MKTLTYTCLLVAASCLWVTPCRAAGIADWPQWRGVNRDGVCAETGLLQTWPAEGPALAWKTKGLGAGYSGVSVVGSTLFTMGDGADASFIYALRESDGQQLWAAKVGKTGGGDGYPGPRCTPTVDGDLVFAIGQFGDLVCVETATGKERWRKNLVKDFAGAMPNWGYAESPLVDGGKVICTPGGPQGTVVALDRSSGKELWRTSQVKDASAYSSAIVAEIGGKRQFVVLTDASVLGIGAEDGQVLWRAPRKGQVAVIPTPVFYNDSVFVSSGYGVGCNLFKISLANDQFKPEQVYANKVMVNHHGGVIRIGEHLYGYSDGKGWVCQNFKTGKMVWEEKGKLGKGAITYADGRFYLRGESKGTMVLIEATPDGYKETGRFEQPDRSNKMSWPHPVVAHGKLYLRDQDVLLCYTITK